MVKAKKNSYDNESITSLKGADRVRKRPAVIFGSDGLEGCQHSFFEILSNSIDEAREGYGEVIQVIRHADWSITVKDNGRGVPVDYNNKEERFNWELVYCELYAGGKYQNNSGENYEYSLGLNGLGACATQYSSEFMEITVWRDQKKHELFFQKGENVHGGLRIIDDPKHATGTTTHWRPDLAVFTDIHISLAYYQDILKKQAVVNAGLRFELMDEFSGETFVYFYAHGIEDYIQEINEGKNFTSVKTYSGEGRGKDREDKPEYKVKVQLSFCFNNEINRIEYYHNSSYLEHGGAPDKAVRTAFVYEMDRLIKNLNKYNKDEKKISFIDVEESLVLIVNSFSTVTSYENQTKKAINNKYIQEFLTDFIKKDLEIYFIENKAEAEKIAEQILINKRSRERAEKTRLNLRTKLTGQMDLATRVKKFVDCRTKDLEQRELYIVEGDSALGACKQARDAGFQALMPVRGKILNCLKADYDKVFASEIVVDLLKVLGCGVEIKTKHNRDLNTFDLSQLNWNKVIICTDADVDGFQIRTLILTLIWRLVPTLIEVGKVYIAESPLFEITTKKKTYFAYSDQERTSIVSRLKDPYTIQRSKGLGENEPEMMWKTTMCPDTRKLILVTPEDAEKTTRMFDVLLGDDLEGRKSFIALNGNAYLDMIDVS